MPEHDDQLRADVQEALVVAKSQMSRLEAAGFELNQCGEYRAGGATVVLYPGAVKVGAKWVPGYEVDICLPAGALGFDIPGGALHLSIGPARPVPPATGERSDG